MGTKVVQVFPEMALERILGALERELIEASDADILEAAGDLGMKPHMKGSAAFFGLRYSAALRAAEAFDPRWLLQMLNDPRRICLASAGLPTSATPLRAAPSRGSSRTRRAKLSRPPKEPRER